MPSLEFTHQLTYPDSAVGITMPVILDAGGERVEVIEAKIDTGADHCIFAHKYAEILELDQGAGHSLTFRFPNGNSSRATGHTIALESGDLRIEETMVYFWDDEDVQRNVLGRTGWLNRIVLGIHDQNRTLYLRDANFE